MTYSLANKVIVITGSTGGLGLASAKALRQYGVRLALLDLNESEAQAQASQLGDSKTAAGFEVDVRSYESVSQAMQNVVRHFGRIDVVIANAGVGNGTAMECMTPEHFERSIDINLTGVWRTFHVAIPYLKETQGYLLAVSSMAAFVHSPLNTHYTASKAGVWAMCNSLRLELKHTGIAVGTLHPTFFKTPMMDAEADGPASRLVWNNHKGVWKFTSISAVVNGLIDGIEQRKEFIVVPGRNSLIAKAPGFFRPFIERFAFNNERTLAAVKEAIRRYKP